MTKTHVPEIRGHKDVRKESLERLLRSHFKDDALRVVGLEDGGGLSGVNVGFCSAINKATVKYTTSDCKEARELRLIVKNPTNNFFAVMGKAMLPFRLEIEMYTKYVSRI